MSGEIIFPNSIPIRITQQPDGNYAWVSNDEYTMTEFQSPKNMFDTTALLAHNHGAGKYLFDLKIGDKINYATKMGDGKSLSDLSISPLTVKEIHRYQALKPRSITSDFVDVETGEKHTADGLFKLMYNNKGKTVFQTCIEKDGNMSWGRMFVVAE